MHDTAEAIGGAFLQQYSTAGQIILELGAFEVNGSIKSFRHSETTYVGLDFERGPGVDVVISDGSNLPIRTQSVDLIVATSVFEHDSFFWLTFLELLRILKAGGLLYINAPSNGGYHRYPTDNWRFYPDAGKMLEKWGRKNGHDVWLIESFVADRRSSDWNDFVAIFQHGNPSRPTRYLYETFQCSNVWRLGANEPTMVRARPEDLVIRDRLAKENRWLKRQLSKLGPEQRSPLVSAKIDQQERLVEFLQLHPRAGNISDAKRRLDELTQQFRNGRG